MVQQSYSFQLSNYDLIFADKYLNTWTTDSKIELMPNRNLNETSRISPAQGNATR